MLKTQNCQAEQLFPHPNKTWLKPSYNLSVSLKGKGTTLFYYLLIAEAQAQGETWPHKIWRGFLEGLHFLVAKGWMKFIILALLGIFLFHLLTKWLSRPIGLIIAIAAFGLFYFILFPQMASTLKQILPPTNTPSPPPPAPIPGVPTAPGFIHLLGAYLGLF